MILPSPARIVARTLSIPLSNSNMPHPLSRRAVLKTGVAFAATLRLGLRRARGAAINDAADAAQKIHDEIWRRFIDEHGILIDYTDFDGSFPRPTAEECREERPNALGWWTPIENGSMFNGLYLDAAVHRWKISRAEADKDKARKLVEGLLLLASLGPARLSCPRPRHRRQNALPHGFERSVVGVVLRPLALRPRGPGHTRGTRAHRGQNGGSRLRPCRRRVDHAVQHRRSVALSRQLRPLHLGRRATPALRAQGHARSDARRALVRAVSKSRRGPRRHASREPPRNLRQRNAVPRHQPAVVDRLLQRRLPARPV